MRNPAPWCPPTIPDNIVEVDLDDFDKSHYTTTKRHAPNERYEFYLENLRNFGSGGATAKQLTEFVMHCEQTVRKNLMAMKKLGMVDYYLETINAGPGYATQRVWYAK